MSGRTSLDKELAELEKTNPMVAKAARDLRVATERVLAGYGERAHPLPCRDASCAWHGA